MTEAERCVGGIINESYQSHYPVKTLLTRMSFVDQLQIRYASCPFGLGNIVVSIYHLETACISSCLTYISQ